MNKHGLVRLAKRSVVVLGVIGVVGGSVLAFDSHQRQQAKDERLRSYPQRLSVYECTSLVFCSSVSPFSLETFSFSECERRGREFIDQWIVKRGTSILTRFEIECYGHDPENTSLFGSDYN